MRNPVIIVLSILLAVAILALLLVSRQYIGTKDTLLVHEKKVSDFSEKIVELEQEKAALHERVQEDLKHVEELQRATERISELENSMESLNKEMASAGSMVTEIGEQLENSELNISQLREEIEKGESEVESLRSQLSDLRKQNEEATVLIEQLKSKHDVVVSQLDKEIENHDRTIAVLHKELKAETSRANDFKEIFGKAHDEIEGLKSQLSDAEEQKRLSEAQAAQMKSGYEGAVSELNQEIRKRDFRVAELESKLEEAKSEVNTLEDENRKGESRTEGLEQRISELLGEKNLLKNQMDQLSSTHASMVSELEDEVRKKEVTIEELEDKLTITFVDHVLFDFGKANISPEGGEILTRVGKILKNVNDKRIRVVGHTDNVPIMKEYRYKFPSNWELSAARAAAVVRHFQKEIGIDPENLEAVGRSFYVSVATNETEEGRAQNRRVNIVIAPKIE